MKRGSIINTMKKILVPLIVILLFIGLVYVTVGMRKDSSSSTPYTTYSNADIGLQFTYAIGPDGYVIKEEIPNTPTDAYLRTITLIQSSDAVRGDSFIGEYPPTHSIRIFKNISSLTPENWVQKYTNESLFALKQGPVDTVTLGGVQGIMYQADGLYSSRVIVLGYGGYIYVVKGEFIDTTSKQYGDFVSLVQSIQFIPLSPLVVKDFEGEADPKRMTLDMKEWSWVKTVYADGTTVAPKVAKKFALTLKKDSTFSASTDCNGVGGEYTANKNSIKFERMMSTLMFCEGSQEQEFSRMLADTKGYTFTSKGELVLTLTAPQGSVYFR